MLRNLQLAALLLVISAATTQSHAESKPIPNESGRVTVDHDATVHVPSLAVPLSIYMSEEARRKYSDLQLHWPTDLPPPKDAAASLRESVELWLRPQLARAKATYSVNVEERIIGGVRTDLVTPGANLGIENDGRVLINLHGGALLTDAPRSRSLVEAIPMAATGRIKVVSIDYRQAPDYKFPAASEDVAAVYKELLKTYKPGCIGILGHSGGSALVAMSLAWFQDKGLPRPGAVGLFSIHSGSGIPNGGDFLYTATPLFPLFNIRHLAPVIAPGAPVQLLPYLSGADVANPLVAPLLHPSVFKEFPPTLIVTGTRDSAASTMIHIHRKLVNAGVDSRFEVWEGMWSDSLYDVDLPESKEIYKVAAKFLSSQLQTQCSTDGHS